MFFRNHMYKIQLIKVYCTLCDFPFNRKAQHYSPINISSYTVLHFSPFLFLSPSLSGINQVMVSMTMLPITFKEHVDIDTYINPLNQTPPYGILDSLTPILIITKHSPGPLISNNIAPAPS